MSDTRRLFANLPGLAAALIFSVCFAFSADAVEAPDGCYPIPASVQANYAQPANLDLIKAQLLYYRCSQYDADVEAVLAEAKKWVALRAPQVAKPAIVFDIDETSLSNWTRIYRDGFAYIADGPCDLAKPSEACGDQAWRASEQAPALGPTLDLYKFARCLDIDTSCRQVEAFFITGRRISDHKINDKTPTEWTLENLDKAGYKALSPDHLTMRPADSNGPVALYKSAARAEIEARNNVTIIANVGDQQSDLDGGHAERTFKVPNPFYFIP